MIKIDPKELQARLKAANEEASKGFQNLPDGPAYHMVLEKVELTNSKAGDPMVVHHCKVLSGDYAGKSHKMFSLLNNDVALRIMLQMWRTLGMDTDQVDSVEMIKAATEEITKERFQFICSIITNDKGYQNTRILSLVAQAEKPAPVTAPTPTPTTAKPVTAAKPVATKPAPVPVAEEVMEEESAEEEFTVDKGVKISFTFNKNSMKGEITEVDEPNETVKVKTEEGKIYKIKVTSITGPA